MMVEQPKKEELIEVIRYIDNFIESIVSGEGYWVAPNGEKFTTDVGYGIEFWEQVSDYLKRNAE